MIAVQHTSYIFNGEWCAEVQPLNAFIYLNRHIVASVRRLKSEEIGNEESKTKRNEERKKWTEKEFTGTLIKSRFYSHIQQCLPYFSNRFGFESCKKKKKEKMLRTAQNWNV